MSNETQNIKKLLKKNDYIGMKFNHLTVMEFDHYNKRSVAYFKCKCDCGNECIVSSTGLRSGNNKSCGCIWQKHKSNFGEKRKDQTSHGDSYTRLYRIWASMKARCASNDPHKDRYYDRGISVCAEWQKYEPFKEWALRNGYDENADFGKCTLDRIDVSGNYEPSNCRWVDMKTQGRNRQATLYVNFQGRKMPLKEACEIANIPYSTAYKRIKYNNMDAQEALSSKRICSRGLRK